MINRDTILNIKYNDDTINRWVHHVLFYLRYCIFVDIKFVPKSPLSLMDVKLFQKLLDNDQHEWQTRVLLILILTFQEIG